MTTGTIITTDDPLAELLDQPVIVRTVTMYYTGTLVAYDPHWLVLDDAAWVADTGRWSTALSMGELYEVEPYPGRCYVSAGAVVDISPWLHALPRTTR